VTRAGGVQGRPGAQAGRALAAALVAAVLAAGTGCVTGSKIRADAEVISADIERARRSGALECAPVDLATAEAELDFAQGELDQGNSTRAGEHVRASDAAVKRALSRSRDCATRQVASQKDAPPVVVRVEPTDTDSDGVGEKEDRCPGVPEDRDGFQDADGCPDPDNDADGVLDPDDKCPLEPGAPDRGGCPEQAPRDADGDGVDDVADKCGGAAEDKDGFEDTDGCPEPDNDDDGLLDRADKCPLEPGPPTNLGCPLQDRDGDGVKDGEDGCPDEPEDRDGVQDADGCPDLDNDRDGVPDAQDRCAAEAEDRDGFQDEDGCPDVDNDADGFPDSLDKCPLEPGLAELVGCPDRDGDGDGLVDRVDGCPAEKGLTELKGCPDRDRDGDGVVDRADRCPDEAGVAAEQGCPKQYKKVIVRKDRIELKQQIRFGTSSARIVGRDSYVIIGEVAQALKEHPQIKRIRVEGHTDDRGNDVANLRLSQNRADAVRAELIKRGVDPLRLISVGYGEAKPIAPNTTPKGRALNRRTEFNVME
jgi:outer membrane protein OmpA-like peptidoglycan-associated protein